MLSVDDKLLLVCFVAMSDKNKVRCRFVVHKINKLSSANNTRAVVGFTISHLYSMNSSRR